MIFVEPFCGACNVLLGKPRSACEVVNDIDPGVVSLLTAVRDTPRNLMAQLRAIPYTEDSFHKALQTKTYTTNLDQAVNQFVLRRMSRGGLMKAFAWSDRLRGGQAGDVNGWQTIIEQLPAISERLNDVQIYHQTALQIVNAFDDENVVIYADPPYVKSTRKSKEVYLHEMSDDEHRLLGQRLRKVKGKVLISGYPSKLYDEELFPDWYRISRKIANHASQRRIKEYKEEVLWLNYEVT
jgi:DNA adenine methylase